MKALSIKQPWLWAITNLDKRIENRTWRPPDFIIGQRIALHASKTGDVDGYAAIHQIAGVYVPLSEIEPTYGKIIATARVVGCVEQSGDKWFFGPYGWVLDDVIVFLDTEAHKGSLGLWDVRPDIWAHFARPANIGVQANAKPCVKAQG